MTASFVNNNRNKRSISIDLKSDERGALKRLSQQPMCLFRISGPALSSVLVSVRMISAQ